MKTKQSAVEGIHAMIRAKLNPGEQILWVGKAEPFSLLEKDSKKSILMQWAIYAVVAVALLGLYLSYSVGANLPPNMLLIAVIVLSALFLASMPGSAKKKIESSEAYVVTDQRVISMGVKTNMKALPRTGLKIRRETLQNGTEIILMGTACEKPITAARHITLYGLSDHSGEEQEGMAFYSVKDAKKICDLIEA